MPRATTAACEVMPPRVVRMPSAACMPWMSSGEVSTRTRITFLPPAFSSAASSEVNTISPEAAPGEAGRPLAITLRCARGSMVGCSSWSSVERIDAQHRLLARDQPFVGELDRDAQRGLGGALAGARLQHPQLALLDREFEVLHVAVVPLERVVDALELGIGFRQRRFHRRLVGARLLARRLADLLRRADAGDHVLALRVDEEFAVQLLLAGRGIAREGDAGRRGLAHVAEHHGLHVDRGAPAFRNAVQAAVGVGALVHPGAEHRADRAPQLRVRILREGLAQLLLHALLVALDELGPVVGRQIGVEVIALALLVMVEQFLEMLMAEAEHDVGIHGDEAPVAVIGEAPVAGFLGQRLHGLVVEAEIEHGVHHAGHRGARARAHRHQERVHFVAESLAGDFADLRQRLLDLRLQDPSDIACRARSSTCRPRW